MDSTKKQTLEKLLKKEPTDRGNFYMPRYHLYPSNPQILHSLVLELFVHAKTWYSQKTPFIGYLPHGPIYKYGGTLATAWKDIFLSHPAYTNLIVLTNAILPDDITAIVTSDDYAHSFFGTIWLNKDWYVWWVMQSSEMFALHAAPLEAQLPFIRAYKHVNNVSFYIVNTEKSQTQVDDFLDTMKSHHGKDACFVFVASEEWDNQKFVKWIKGQAGNGPSDEL